MYLALDGAKGDPLYQQLAAQISTDITRGALPPGCKLPTVRNLAAQSGISQGTIKHAYDILERGGLVKKTRGSGTFVYSPQVDPRSSKTLAMQSIDAMIDRMQELSFSLHDIRIFFDLKLREREAQTPQVMVAAVDCNPEALSVICAQIAGLPHTEVRGYLLEEVLHAPGYFDPPADAVVTTATHYQDLSGKMPPGRPPCRLVMTVGTDTALGLAALPSQTRLGIITVSKRFSHLMLQACEKYGNLAAPVRTAFFGDRKGILEHLQTCDRLLLPSAYERFASPEESALLRSCGETHRPLRYCYQVERGSMLYLEEQLEGIFKTHQGRAGLYGMGLSHASA